MSAGFTQEGGSHISYEDKLTTKVIPAMLMAFTAAGAVIANLFAKRRREGGGMHPTLKFMLAALGMHWVFLALHTLHLRSFAGWCCGGCCCFLDSPNIDGGPVVAKQGTLNPAKEKNVIRPGCLLLLVCSLYRASRQNALSSPLLSYIGVLYVASSAPKSRQAGGYTWG